jgi:hypothetical protein
MNERTIESLGCLALIAGGIFGAWQVYQYFQDSKRPTLEEQRVCATQAAKFAKEKDPRQIDEGWSYTSHYNPKRGICFVETRRMIIGQGVTVVLTISDAFEGNEYAYLSLHPRGGPTCILRLTQPGEICKSAKEWEIGGARELMNAALVTN